MTHLIESFIISSIILLSFSIICIALQKLSPSNKTQKFWRPDTKTDLFYWLFSIFVTGYIVIFLVTTIVTLISIFKPDIITTITNFKDIKLNPWHVFFALILVDLIAYWTHRLMHSRRLWRLHAVHHSSKEIDWLSANRFHPLESITIAVVSYTILLTAGFDFKTATLAYVIRGSYGYIQHANLSWSYGPLGYIFASPYFHRWHHTKEKEGLNKNFAGVFSIWDWLFGTAYHPKAKQPHNFGAGKDVGDKFWQQLLFPFRK